MEEWGGKYSTKGEAWETLKGICASSDIQLQGVLEETEKEVMAEQETQADIADEEQGETSPLLAKHNKNSEVLAESESDRANSKEAKKTSIIIENDTERTPLNADREKEDTINTDGTKEKQQPQIANVNKSPIKGTQAEQDMTVVLHKNTQGNVFNTNKSSMNKERQTESATDQKISGEALTTATERVTIGQNVNRTAEETKPSMSSQERKEPRDSLPRAKSGSIETGV